jgi:uncharacterized protein YciI
MSWRLLLYDVAPDDLERSAAEAFAAADPYVRNGLVTSWRVRPWTVVVGGE